MTSPTGTPDRDAFHVYDTTLRDGAQREGISYSVSDKLAVSRLLDELGVGFIEGGWPGALPKDTEFFAPGARRSCTCENAQLVAFGSTRKAGVRVEDDAQVQALLDSGAPVITLVAKSDLRHVAEALRTTPEENLAMVRDTVAHLVAARAPCVRRLRALLRRLPPRPRLRRRAAAGRRRGGHVGRCALRHQRRNAAQPYRRRGRRRARAQRGADRASTARTTPPARSPTRSRRSRQAPRTCSARPTGTASAPATPTCSRSWATSR